MGLIWDRSGIAFKNGLTVMAGVIDYTYTGEYEVLLFNTSNKDYIVKKGYRIAQLLIQPIVTVKIQEVQELSQTERGCCGFGSTGK